jgi:wobble nucleotide-excising tRNase
VFIKQVKHIGAVGRFRACAAEGDVAFKKYTLLFGENGRGKTTLCAILRSLQTNNPDIIAGRKTLGQEKDPNVVLMLESGTAIFSNNAWNDIDSRLKIFDAQFVTDNIYIGDEIGTEQRRNLCNVILGTKGVELAERYNGLDTKITRAGNEIRNVKRVLTSHVSGAELEDFLEVEEDPEVDAEIELKAREVEGLREIDKLRTYKELERLTAPRLPSKLEEILGRTLSDVSSEAETLVKKHLAEHQIQEEWVAKGVSHAEDDSCPFCGQDIKGLDLIAAYKAFFNANYLELKEQLENYSRLPAQNYSNEHATVVQSVVQANAATTEVWKRYVKFETPRLIGDFDIPALFAGFRAETESLLAKKSAALLEGVPVSEAYNTARSAIEALCKAMEAYNEAVEKANLVISAFKTNANPKRLQAAINELRWLELTKKRHEPEIAAACESYIALSKAKEDLEGHKVTARSQLEEYSRDVVTKYCKRINHYLKRFNAGFHLDEMKVEFTGRIANSTFCIVINETSVQMGSSETPISEPSFKNTLSAGDKSTLALAFFLAELDANEEKSDCIVVFDDPFNSQDHFRRTCTATEIRRCGDGVAQVIVMSHDKHFLRELWRLPLPSDNRKALWLIPFGHKDTVIAEWLLETDTESEDDANRRVLLDYYHKSEGEPRDVIQKLRPVIETHMRRIAPQLLGKIDGLGKMLEKVRETDGPPILVEAYDDIDDLNVYTRKYMHGETPNADKEPVVSTELQGFVSKALEIAGALTQPRSN